MLCADENTTLAQTKSSITVDNEKNHIGVAKQKDAEVIRHSKNKGEEDKTKSVTTKGVC